MIRILLENDSKHEDNRIRGMGLKDDISLKVIEGDRKIIEHEISHLKVAILEMIFTESLYREKQDFGKTHNLIVDGLELIRDGKI